jgi:hypothetical protein
MTIGELKKILKTAKPNQNVIFDFCNCIPTTIDSWRGIYAEPALGWAATGYSAYSTDENHTSVEKLLNELNKATLNTYFGWKGGEYHYDDNSPLHIDNSGDYSQTEIDSVEVTDFDVIIYTKKFRYDE